jgi:nucleotide-binding universal stress UspA family protein
MATAHPSDAPGVGASGDASSASIPRADPAIPAVVFERPSRGLTIRHILVPMDGSALAGCAVPFAAALAEVFAARLTLLRVLTAPNGHVDPVAWELRRAEAHAHLADIERRLTERGLAASVAVLEGRPADRVLHFAHDHDVDLIVLSSHGEGGLTAWILSSTAHKVIARTHSSVLVVPAYGTEAATPCRYRRILLPLDCSPRAECVLPIAAALARAHDAEIVLAHVIPEPELPRRMPASASDVALARQLTDRNREESERYLRSLAADLAAQHLRVRTETVVSPRRHHTLLELAESLDVDLIVVSAHGATGDPADRYGSMAEHLLQRSNRPILVLQDLSDAVRESTRAAEAAQPHAGH